MTIQKALDITDELKANGMLTSLKIGFLSELEGKLWREVFTQHADPPAEECPEYDENTDTSTELLVPDHRAMVYVYWLESKIDEQDREWDEYNNHRALFQNAWEDFADEWRRNHMPVAKCTRFIL